MAPYKLHLRDAENGGRMPSEIGSHFRRLLTVPSELGRTVRIDDLSPLTLELRLNDRQSLRIKAFGFVDGNCVARSVIPNDTEA